MSLGTVLIVILLVLLLTGGFARVNDRAWLGTGYYGGGAVGLLLAVLLVLLLLGRL